MSLEVAGHVSKQRKQALAEFLEEVPEVLQEAILACSAPRHAALDDDAKNARDDYGKKLRRKWFGKKRGTVRHTFRDILRHIEKTPVYIHEHGPRCFGSAHAYTPDDQDQNIYLCDKFFADDAFGQMSTLIHELTHLVRKTADFDLPDDEREFSQGLTVESLHSDDSAELKEKFREYLKTGLSRDNSVRSAYNYEYFIRELLEETYDAGIIRPVR